jgi:hypothetical protein
VGCENRVHVPDCVLSALGTNARMLTYLRDPSHVLRIQSQSPFDTALTVLSGDLLVLQPYPAKYKVDHRNGSGLPLE